MKLVLPDKLLGRVYRCPAHPNHARMKACWNPEMPLPPASWDVDAHLPNGVLVAPSMDMNDVDGDCAKAAQGKLLRRFLVDEYGKLVAVTPEEIAAAYFAETGGADTGLVIEDSLTLWQNTGWVGGGQLRKIGAFGRVNAADVIDVQRAVTMLGGAIIGVQMPLCWQDSIDAKVPWDVPADMSDPRSQLGGWGGHAMAVLAYDPTGVIVESWGQRFTITWNAMAWAAVEKNEGECLGIVRANDAGIVAVDGLDTGKLLSDLQLIQER